MNKVKLLFINAPPFIKHCGRMNGSTHAALQACPVDWMGDSLETLRSGEGFDLTF